MWFQTSSQLFFNIHCISLPFKKQDKIPYPTVFSPPWFVKGTDPSFCFSSTFQPEFWAWGKPLLSMTPVSNPIPTNLEWDFFLLPFYNHDLYYSVHCTWELKFVWWMFFHEEIYLNHLLLYEMFYINLFSPFKAGIPKASLTIGNSTTTLQLTWYTERTILPESFLAECFFSLSWLSLEFTC